VWSAMKKHSKGEEDDPFHETMRTSRLIGASVKVLIEKRLENARYQNVNRGNTFSMAVRLSC